MRCLALLLVALAHLPATAVAQVDRVLVLIPEGEASRRLEAELLASGFEVGFEPGGSMRTETALFERMERRGAAAAVVLQTDISSAEVWVVERATGRLIALEVANESDVAGTRPEHVVVRAVEALRASLIEVGPPGPRPSLETAPVGASVSAEQAAPQRAWLLELGVVVGGTAGGISPPVWGRVAAEWRAHRWLALGVVADIPLRPDVLRAAEGESKHWPVLVHLAGRVPFLDAAGALQPFVGIGLGAVFVTARSQAAPGFSSLGGDAVAATAHLELGLRWAVADWLRIGLEARAGVALPRVVIRFAGREVSSFGRPHFASALTLGLAL